MIPVATEICVEFNQIRYDVSEGDGFAILTLVSSTPIDTEYTVEVLTQDRTAKGMYIHSYVCAYDFVCILNGGSIRDRQAHFERTLCTTMYHYIILLLYMDYMYICVLILYPAGDDYLIGGTPFSTTFASGESSAFVLIPIRDDSVLEKLESFFAGLSIPGPAASLGVKAGARDNSTVYIDDNDSVEVVFDPISYNVSECDGEVNLTLRANSTASCDYTVCINTSDISATGEICA